MTLMLIGNSLTAGNLGIAYSRYLDFPEKPDNRIINLGLDGDTLQGVKNRLRKALEKEIPDILVIQTGANDILLPEMKSRGGDWASFVKAMTDRGSIPAAGPGEFLDIYSEMIEETTARGIDIRDIICVTIPPLGENLQSSRNRIRRDFNRSILKAVKDTGAVPADAAREFEQLLQGIETPSDWFFENPEDFTADVKEVRRGKGAMKLSEERGLYLTMDGAHLNEKGAELMAGVISTAIAMEAVPRRVRQHSRSTSGQRGPRRGIART